MAKRHKQKSATTEVKINRFSEGRYSSFQEMRRSLHSGIRMGANRGPTRFADLVELFGPKSRRG